MDADHFNKRPPRQHQRDVIGDRGVDNEHRDVERNVGRHAPGHQRPREIDRMLERQEIRHARERGRHLIDGKVDAREQQHGRQNEREEISEKIVARRERVHQQTKCAEHESDQKSQWKYPDGEPCVAVSKRHDDRENGDGREHRFGRGPDPLREHDVVERDRCIDDTVPSALHVHSRECRIHALETRGEHRALTDHAGADERDVLHAADVSDQRSQSVAQCQHVEQRIGNVTEHARNRELSPNQQIAPPNRREAIGKPRRKQERGGTHLKGSRHQRDAR
jgi:hypothetical protein